eukprot:scaffold36447_cov18-Tisochrysis_lutea.AAC.3
MSSKKLGCKHNSPVVICGLHDPQSRDPNSLGRGSFSHIRDAGDKKWRSGAIECWLASDASAVVEHTKRCAHAGGFGGMEQTKSYVCGGGGGLSIKCWLASDASAVVEHTKRCVGVCGRAHVRGCFTLHTAEREL